jgi:hypothetical protein
MPTPPAIPPGPATTDGDTPAPAAAPDHAQPDHAQPDHAVARRPRVSAFARRHALFGAVCAAGMALRAAAVVAYRPALMYLGDSGAYLDQAWHRVIPGDWRPSGYPMFLRIISGQAHLTRLVVAQHLLTFAAGVALYAAAVRVVGRPWLAALVATPAVVSPWVVDLGQFVLADSLFGSLVLAGLLLVASPGRPPLWACGCSGLLLGAAVTVRSVGYGPLLAVAVVLVAAARTVGPQRIGGFAVAAAVPLVGYSTWSAAHGGPFSVSGHSGFFLYGRVVPFADCSVITRADLRTLCDPRPVSRRLQPDAYLWPASSPLRQGDRDIPAGREKLAGEFAAQILRRQPGMMVTTTATYLAGYFSPVRHETSKTSRADTWEFPRRYTNALPASDPHAYDGYLVTAAIDPAVADPLSAYSRAVYVTMPLVGLGLLAGLAAAARSALGRGPARRRPPPRLFWLCGGTAMSVLLLGSLTAGFDYRYLGSVIGPLGAAAVLGTITLIRSARTGSAG